MAAGRLRDPSDAQILKILLELRFYMNFTANPMLFWDGDPDSREPWRNLEVPREPLFPFASPIVPNVRFCGGLGSAKRARDPPWA